ncbi:MAG: glycosyl transferase family 2 [Bdellovibrionales bacterium CG10_big_fil_rev_8_21_14_0_10_45_34]|nr:MAG: glycosyl transferase family 2 [Bdellovibrionales bacterium CG10_big_fil_rev_8_21_14_0_10_45_34]
MVWALAHLKEKIRRKFLGAKSIYKERGLRAFYERLIWFIVVRRNKYNSMLRYNIWLFRQKSNGEAKKSHGLTPHDLKGLAGPKISILTPTYNTELRVLKKMIQSVLDQTYTNWELCIADDNSPRPEVKEVIGEFAKRDARIRVCLRQENGHISKASNTALALATGEFVGLLDHDDELTPDALAEVVKVVQRQPNVDLIYSDEDKISKFGIRFDPHFKPDWDPELLLTQNYVCHFSVYRVSLVRDIGGFREGYEGSQDWDLLLRFSEKTAPEKIVHIPKVLYHWRAIEGSVASGSEQKPYAHMAARRAIQDYFYRNQISAVSLPGYGPLTKVRYELKSQPRVSLIVATKDRADLLERTIMGILSQRVYLNFEIVIVDNQSIEKDTLRLLESFSKNPKIKIIKFDQPFNFSKIYNYGVRVSTGEVVGLLNNDLEFVDEAWLLELVSHVVRGGVGAVGPLLLYPDGKVQHAGIVLGMAGGVAGHIFKGSVASEPGYMGRIHCLRQVSAVTGACLFVTRRAYEEVGGLDEENLAVAYNDVDFCLKLTQAGYRNIYTPFTSVIHHESATRGFDTTPEKRVRLQRESEFMKSKWNGTLEKDPYHNKNLSLNREKEIELA